MKVRRGPLWALFVFLLLLGRAAPPAEAAGLPREIVGDDGAPMVLVPKGEFIMGSPAGFYIFGDNETPQRRVHLEAFYIDKYEVTNKLYRKLFTAARKYPGVFLLPDQPIVGVNWGQARDYCVRVNKRLPTEAEWEKAARGTDGRVYPWGNQRATCRLAVMGTEIPSCSRGFSTWEVGSRLEGASPYGAMDMAGNVTEWVADWYSDRYYRSAPSRSPKGPAKGKVRVIRGGAWFNSNVLLRSAFRTGFDPRRSNHGVGFRCAKTATASFVRRSGRFLAGLPSAPPPGGASLR